MALKNYLLQNSYSIVDSHQYSKMSNSLRFFLKIYADDTKQIELASKSFEVSRYVEYRSLGDHRLSPPENPKVGEGFYVSKDATGEWSGKSGHIAEWDVARNSWGYWGLGRAQIYYSESGDYYFTMNYDTEERIKAYPTDDFRLWDKWFSADKIFSSDSNLHKQCYEFLKSRPSFENVTDC